MRLASNGSNRGRNGFLKPSLNCNVEWWLEIKRTLLVRWRHIGVILQRQSQSHYQGWPHPHHRRQIR